LHETSLGSSPEPDGREIILEGRTMFKREERRVRGGKCAKGSEREKSLGFLPRNANYGIFYQRRTAKPSRPKENGARKMCGRYGFGFQIERGGEGVRPSKPSKRLLRGTRFIGEGGSPKKTGGCVGVRGSRSRPGRRGDPITFFGRSRGHKS